MNAERLLIGRRYGGCVCVCVCVCVCARARARARACVRRGGVNVSYIPMFKVASKIVLERSFIYH